ncbi:MAG TPA: MTH865 family protein [Kofleriaceae bacterium]|nr:MTH865 family protein [Kofleriaceae bacterium]
MPDIEDRKLLDLVRTQDKDTADLIDHLLSTGHITFPINDERELVHALGGASTHVTVGPRSVTIRSLAARVPAHYFPITDEHELHAKIADLALHFQRPAPGSATAARLMPATAAKPPHGPPSIPEEEFRKVRAAHPGRHLVGVRRP